VPDRRSTNSPRPHARGVLATLDSHGGSLRPSARREGREDAPRLGNARRRRPGPAASLALAPAAGASPGPAGWRGRTRASTGATAAEGKFVHAAAAGWWPLRSPGPSARRRCAVGRRDCGHGSGAPGCEAGRRSPHTGRRAACASSGGGWSRRGRPSAGRRRPRAGASSPPASGAITILQTVIGAQGRMRLASAPRPSPKAIPLANCR
jgi:hypothetical protein